jgi:hypothetical protein
MPNWAVAQSSATLWRHVTCVGARGLLEGTLLVDLSLSRGGPVAFTRRGALVKPLRSPDGSENASEETETRWQWGRQGGKRCWRWRSGGLIHRVVIGVYGARADEMLGQTAPREGQQIITVGGYLIGSSQLVLFMMHRQ